MSDAASETETEKHCEGGRLLDEQAQAFEQWIIGEREQSMVSCDDVTPYWLENLGRWIVTRISCI